MDDLREKIAALFEETGHAHHEAYIETDGADPDWPIWYADYLHDKLKEHLDAAFTKSELIWLLVSMDFEQRSTAPGSNWRLYYADFLISRYV